jgi:hypothetical protein
MLVTFKASKSCVEVKTSNLSKFWVIYFSMPQTPMFGQRRDFKSKAWVFGQTVARN